ncbi:MAG: flagellar basal-body rod protein FlgG [Planctomycetes bacterium]|nr:flagellar basal-body rod protein FlgG [Planctomycetota bacterium]
MHTAITGLEALSTEIDVIANNLANVNTVGFKRARANFEDLLYVSRGLSGAGGNADLTPPAGTDVGLGVQVSNIQTLFTQGSPIETGRATDLAIQGEGFFRVRIFDDVGGGFGYTRAGSFVANRDGDLVMANSDGFRLDPPVTIPVDATDVAVTSDGAVLAVLPGDAEATQVGQIALYRFPNETGLEHIGKNLFITTAASGEADEGNPGEGGFGSILGNFLESSNVTAVRELVDLIKTQRAFELNSRVITTSDEMLQTITHLK